ncbi:hypothetical protein ABW19_dt0202222 [Dactylella cylindrospora]|nr:hypothetical protein ABW19_dt0202222 [Dactylella cylindrospora]
MAATPYIQDVVVGLTIGTLQAHQINLSSSLWYNILRIEFCSEPGTLWSLERQLQVRGDDDQPSLYGYYACLQSSSEPWNPSEPVRYQLPQLSVVYWSHSRLPPGKHVKFDIEARQSILLALSFDFDNWSDNDQIIVASTELVVCFFNWEAKNSKHSGRLTRLSMENAETGEKYFGPLHLVDNADAIHYILQEIKRRGEKLHYPSGVEDSSATENQAIATDS